MKKIRQFLPIIILSVMVISGCSSQPVGDPAAATMAYLEALSRQEKTVVVNSVCKEWEDQAALEVDALLSVGTSLKDVNCEVVGEEGDQKLVRCSGELELTYTDEVRFIDLSMRTYSMDWEDGKWRVCSYQ